MSQQTKQRLPKQGSLQANILLLAARCERRIDDVAREIGVPKTTVARVFAQYQIVPVEPVDEETANQTALCERICSILHTEGAMSQSRLRESIGVKQSYLKKALVTLERKGVVYKVTRASSRHVSWVLAVSKNRDQLGHLSPHISIEANTPSQV